MSVGFEVKILERARMQAKAFLEPAQFAYVRDLCKRLEHFGKPADSEENVRDLEIRKLETFHDMRPLYSFKDKGGILGKQRIRIVFGVIPRRNEIVVISIFRHWELPNAIADSIAAVFERYLLTGEPKALPL